MDALQKVRAVGMIGLQSQDLLPVFGGGGEFVLLGKGVGEAAMERCIARSRLAGLAQQVE